MTSVVESVDVPASPQATFDAMTDWERQHEWMAFTDVRPVTRDGRGDGAQIAGRTGLGPLGFLDTMTITEWDPPRQVRVKHTGKLVRGTAAFSVTPRPDGTATFTWSEQLDLPLGPVGAFGFALTRPLFLLFIRRSLDKFAAWVPTR